MFKKFYGFSLNPFDKNFITAKDAFASRDHKEAVARLNYLKDTRGIGVLTARAGMGKSFALRCFASSLNPALYQAAYICLSTVSVTDFYQQLCHVLQVEPSSRKTEPMTARVSSSLQKPAAKRDWISRRVAGSTV